MIDPVSSLLDFATDQWDSHPACQAHWIRCRAYKRESLVADPTAFNGRVPRFSRGNRL